MVVKKFGSQVVYLSVYAPANGYVIDVVFCEPQTFGLYRLHTPQFAALVFKGANCLGVIWSSLTGN